MRRTQEWAEEKLSFVNRTTSLSTAGNPHALTKCREAYRALETLIGDNQYFLGTQTPTLLDVVAFSHLALHYHADIPANTLQTILLFEFPNLVRFIGDFQKKHMPDSLDTSGQLVCYSKSIWSKMRPRLGLMERLKVQYFGVQPLNQTFAEWISAVKQSITEFAGAKQDTETQQTEEADKQMQVFRRNRNISAISAVGAFLFYIWYRGIVSFQLLDNEDAAEYYDYYDDDEEEE